MNERQNLDPLAVERTALANERTLLAYIRTALALAGAGAVLLQYFPDRPWLIGIACALLLIGGVAMVIGSCRFLSVRRRLHQKP